MSIKRGRGITVGRGQNTLTIAQLTRILADATAAERGVSTAVQIAKLDGIASGAEVNPAPVSQAEAEAGTATTERIFTAERVKQAILALETGEINPTVVSQVDAEAGTATDERIWTAQRVAQAIAALESGGSAFSGALAKLDADITSYNTTANIAIPFAAENYDTDTWHDLVTNNTRLTVPAGVARIRATGSVQIGAISTSQFLQLNIRKNGSNLVPFAAARSELSTTANMMQVTTGVVDATEADYFELFMDVESDTSITVSVAGTWFSIEKVE